VLQVVAIGTFILNDTKFRGISALYDNLGFFDFIGLRAGKLAQNLFTLTSRCVRFFGLFPPNKLHHTT